MVVCPRIHRHGYWERIRTYAITHATPMIMAWLLDDPALPSDADNSLERILIGTWTTAADQFCRRFNVGEAYGMFNMTETSSMLVLTKKLGSVGRPRPGVEVRLVDEDDLEVGDGEVGELIVRADLPWEMSLGYANMSEESNRSWRNGWFHTGELLRVDADGDFSFVDRKKDSVRIHDENVSSYEVEAEILSHPQVSRCAVFPVATGAECEEAIMACIVGVPDVTIEPRSIIEFLRPRMAYYMIPRFVEISDALPVTTDQEGFGKVRKRELRERGIASATWDREASGVHVGRQ